MIHAVCIEEGYMYPMLGIYKDTKLFKVAPAKEFAITLSILEELLGSEVIEVEIPEELKRDFSPPRAFPKSIRTIQRYIRGGGTTSPTLKGQHVWLSGIDY